MIQVNVSQARQDFLNLANRVFAGEEFLVVKNNIPMLTMKPIRKEKIDRKKKIDLSAFGIWKNRWPKSMSSVDIVNKWREEAWKGNYGD